MPGLILLILYLMFASMCRNAGTQIQGLARSIYKTEAKAAGMFAIFSRFILLPQLLFFVIFFFSLGYLARA